METVNNILPRQSSAAGYDGSSTGVGDNTDIWLNLISNPFESQIQSTSFYAALAWSFGVSSAFIFLFCLLRPRTSNVYAPRAKHADQKHKPPPLGKGIFSWITAIKSVNELDLVEKIGLDATIFLRFLRMSRNMFICLSIVGCGVLIPVTLSNYSSSPTTNTYSKRQQYAPQGGSVQAFVKMTPQFIWGAPFWAFVVVAYVFNFIIFFFLWWNYRAVTRLRRVYLESSDYRNSLHSRTLLVTQIPSSYRTEDGLIKIVQQGKPTEDIPKVAVGRSLRELPDLIEEHEKSVLELESHLAKYLADPNKLPPNRPMCKPSKHDKGRSGSDKVDAIDYYTGRIQHLEASIKAMRQSIDSRNPLPYGFASYTHVEDAHAVAYATRKKGPQGTTIKLAPKPTDILWKNLPMTGAQRRSQAAWNGFWMILLTVLYIPPNIAIAVFLTNLHKLGLVWSGFNTTLRAHPLGWSIAQGIVAPGIQILIYLALPSIFRRLLVRAGNTTKTSRERHVASKLYAFFLFNNLFVFSVFAAVFAFVSVVVKAENESIWDSIKGGHFATKVAISLCNISPYWITWQLQRNLSAAVDILQAWPLIRNTFLKRFTNPTPRQQIEITAPQHVEYAEYYNNYLFVATVGLTFGALQPLILPVTAFYLAIDVWLKKYMLQYIFITKVESGGAFWRMLVNRILVAVLLMDGVIALLVGTLGIPGQMLYAMIPLLVMLPAFKWYCARAFDTKIGYYTTRTYTEGETGGRSTPGAEKKLRRSQDRVAVRYGHPALYQKLMTPMVHAKSKHLLKDVYHGRLGGEIDETKYDGRPTSVFGYSDIYMGEMDNERPGKMYYGSRDANEPTLPFEMVGESELDFENFKRRADFRNEYGGDGELYGRADDSLSRPTTPSSMMSFGASTLMGQVSRTNSEIPLKQYQHDDGDMEYPRGYAAVGHGDMEYPQEYPRGYAAVGHVSRESSPARGSRGASPTTPGYATREEPYSPQRPIRQSTLVSVEIPTPGLGSGDVTAAGTTAYHGQGQSGDRTSTGSMGAMLYNNQRGGPARKPIASAARGSGPQHHRYGQSGSGSHSGSGYNTPQQQTTPYDDNTSYDYFRRGRMG